MNTARNIIAMVLLALVLIAATPLTVDKELTPTLREWSAAEAVASSTTGVHAAVTDNGSPQTVTTGFTAPPAPRNITVTAGGTAGDIKAISVTVNGTRQGKTISEVIGPFTVDTPGTVAGTKAFSTVTSVVIPAHDGTGATTSVGFGELLGLPHRQEYPIIIAAYKNGAVDASATMAASATALESNTLDMNANLDGDPISVVYLK